MHHGCQFMWETCVAWITSILVLSENFVWPSSSLSIHKGNPTTTNTADHGHEQNNGVNDEWQMKARLVGENLSVSYLNFDSSMVGKREYMGSTSQRKPHEQTDATQKLFATQVHLLIRVIKGMSSPLHEESQDLLRLYSKDIMDKQSIQCLTTIQLTDQQQYRTLV